MRVRQLSVSPMPSALQLRCYMCEGQGGEGRRRQEKREEGRRREVWEREGRVREECAEGRIREECAEVCRSVQKDGTDGI